MNAFPMVALAESGKEMVTFSLSDGIMSIDDERFVLTRRPGTPILLHSTVYRGMDINGLFEGSIVKHKGKDFVISYRRGFIAKDNSGDLVKISSLDSYIPRSHVYFEKDNFSEPRVIRRKKFKHPGCNHIYELRNMMGVTTANELICFSRRDILCPIDKIQQHAGIHLDSKDIFFGDKIDGSIIMLNKGRICIRRGTEIKDIYDLDTRSIK